MTEGNESNPGFNFSLVTKRIHGGYNPNLSEHAVDIPSFQSSTYGFASAEQGEEAFQNAMNGGNLNDLLIYSRVNHPNAGILEDKLKYIEPLGGEAAIFSSGMAAISTTLLAVCPKDKVIAFTPTLYGGTHMYLHGFLNQKFGFEIMELPIDTNEACEVLKKIGSRLGVVYIETPANPTLQMFDIEALAEAGKQANPDSYAILDNTFMGIFQNGFEISGNLDLIVYSCTKFLGGHSDLIGGAVICHEQNRDIMKEIKLLRILKGNILHPHECSQLTTHLYTYDLRMKEQATNATAVARYLKNLRSSKIQNVLHPTLYERDSANYRLFKKQCTGGSSIISLWLNTDKLGTFRFLNAVKSSGIIQLAVSLGGFESLICHPASTTHSEIPKETRDVLGITDNMVRLSIGREDPNDLQAVLYDALQKI